MSQCWWISHTSYTVFTRFKREADDGLAKRCTEMLKRFGRYDLHHLFQHDARKRAMSPRILVDMQRSRVKWCLNLRPIVANSCNYAIRFVSWEICTVVTTPSCACSRCICSTANSFGTAKTSKNFQERWQPPTICSTSL